MANAAVGAATAFLAIADALRIDSCPSYGLAEQAPTRPGALSGVPAEGGGEGAGNPPNDVMDQHAGDIGGTNTRLALYEPAPAPPPRRKQRPLEERIALAEQQLRTQDAAHHRIGLLAAAF